MGRKDDLIAKATELGIELDSTETIADLEAKITAHKAVNEGEMEDDGTGDTSAVPAGSSAWALAALASGKRVMREAWTDNHHLDPAHIRAGIRLTFEDVFATDWKAV